MLFFYHFVFLKVIYGKLEENFDYKSYLAYVVYQFSQYIKTGEVNFLTEIKNIVFDVSIRSIPFTVKNDLKIICLKTVNFFKFHIKF
jgi:hypothetical protein